MSIVYEDNKAKFQSVIYEDEIVVFRDFLQKNSGDAIVINLKECDDVHFALLQLMMAYKKTYDVLFEFPEDRKIFQTVLEGFDTSENHCN